jgi:hypothetical protein
VIWWSETIHSKTILRFRWSLEQSLTDRRDAASLALNIRLQSGT